MDEPRFVIATENHRQPHPVAFKKLFPIKDTIITMALVWPMNSYYVSIAEEYFVVNGGLRLRIEALSGWKKHLEYCRRHRKTMKLIPNGDEAVGHSMVYLLGWKATKDKHEAGYTLLEISEDGRTWQWRDQK